MLFRSGPGESQAAGLLEALLQLPHWPQLPPQAQLSDQHRAWREGEIPVAGHHSCRHPQIPRRFIHLQAPGDGEGKGTLVELKGKDGKALKSVVLGKKQTKKSEGGPFGGGDFPVGRWVRDTASKDSVILTSEQFSDAEPKPENWLDKEFLKVEKLKSIAVTYATNAASGWKATRETEGAE